MQFITPCVGDSTSVHTSALNELGKEYQGIDGSVWVYVKGITGGAQGKAVTYDEAGVTALLAANAKGFVAFLGGSTANSNELDAATKYGFAEIISGPTSTVYAAANSADNTFCGREGADGVVGDGRAAGDEMYNFMLRGATGASAALTAAQFKRPYVDDTKGS